LTIDTIVIDFNGDESAVVVVVVVVLFSLLTWIFVGTGESVIATVVVDGLIDDDDL
jgi:hypothetical protein